MPVWGLNSGILGGYPYATGIDETWYSYENPNKQWQITGGILDGYPYAYWRELTPPYHVPVFATAALDKAYGLVGVSAGLTVTVMSLRNIAAGDVLAFQVLDAQSAAVLSGNITLDESYETASQTYTFAADGISTLTIGSYSVNVTLSRDSESAKSVSLPFQMRTPPYIEVSAVTPYSAQKPITADNDALTISYRILDGADAAQIDGTFSIAGYAANTSDSPIEKLTIESAAQTSSMDTINFNFTVSDNSFVVKSFKFRFGQYNASTRIQLSVDGTTYVDGTFSMPGWVEYTSPSGLALSTGSHTIKVYCPPSYFYAYSTTTKPAMPGMSITSSTIYAMEMVYTISSSGLDGVKTAVLTIDDNIEAGEYPVSVTASVNMNGYGSASLSPITTDNMFSVLPDGAAPPLNPDFGSVTLSAIGRYTGCEIDVTASVSALENILDADTVAISLNNAAARLFTHTDTLSEGAQSYTYIIPASQFAGLAVGDYVVEATIARSEFSVSKQTVYTAVAPPILAFAGISPNVIHLPITAPLTVTAAWSVSGAGVNTIQGTATLAGFSAGANTSSLAFSAVFSDVTGLNEGVYSLAASFSAVSNAYGTVMLTGSYDGVLSVLPAPPVIPETQKDLRSANIYLYNGFTLVAVIRSYVSFKWVRRCNQPGEFILLLEKTPENASLITTGDIIAKDNDTEAGFVEDINITDRIEIRGAFVTKMLDFRVVSYTSETKVSLQTAVEQIIQSNFISGAAARVIQGLSIASYTVSDQQVDVNLNNGSLLAWLQGQNIGYRIAFKPADSAFSFSMYDGGERLYVIFSENYRNISEKEYFSQASASRNVVLIEDEEEAIHEYGSAQGLNRREAFLKAGRYIPDELGQRFLEENRTQKSLDVKIVDPYQPFEYKTEYDIGDTVTVISEDYGVEIVRKILEITEYYDLSGFHLYIVFGDVPKTLLTELAENNRKLDDAWHGRNDWLDNAMPGIFDGIADKLPDLPIGEELMDLIDEAVTDRIVEAVPPLINEKLQDLKQDEVFVDTVNDIVEDKLADAGLTGAYSHVITDHMPSQAEIDSCSENTIVLVYDPSNPYTPGS
ncbi:MAG: siphovirus ReqiPepy6 Gp37-like family protein [Clostridiales bacterium]|nr:siphovirus ReqiPepy6 Gp37-like family protein [Clostridiales bacterium]